MKILFDKIQSGEPHSLSRGKLHLLFSLLPEECRKRVKVVHFSNQPLSNITFDRPVIYSAYSARLTVLSRGFSELRIVHEMLIELAQSSLLDIGPATSIHGAVFANHLKSKGYRFFKKHTEAYLLNYRSLVEQSEFENPR